MTVESQFKDKLAEIKMQKSTLTAIFGECEAAPDLFDEMFNQYLDMIDWLEVNNDQMFENVTNENVVMEAVTETEIGNKLKKSYNDKYQMGKITLESFIVEVFSAFKESEGVQQPPMSYQSSYRAQQSGGVSRSIIAQPQQQSQSHSRVAPHTNDHIKVSQSHISNSKKPDQSRDQLNANGNQHPQASQHSVAKIQANVSQSSSKIPINEQRGSSTLNLGVQHPNIANSEHIQRSRIQYHHEPVSHEALNIRGANTNKSRDPVYPQESVQASRKDSSANRSQKSSEAEASRRRLMADEVPESKTQQARETPQPSKSPRSTPKPQQNVNPSVFKRASIEQPTVKPINKPDDTIEYDYLGRVLRQDNSIKKVVDIQNVTRKAANQEYVTPYASRPDQDTMRKAKHELKQRMQTAQVEQDEVKELIAEQIQREIEMRSHLKAHKEAAIQAELKKRRTELELKSVKKEKESLQREIDQLSNQSSSIEVKIETLHKKLAENESEELRSLKNKKKNLMDENFNLDSDLKQVKQEIEELYWQMKQDGYHPKPLPFDLKDTMTTNQASFSSSKDIHMTLSPFNNSSKAKDEYIPAQGRYTQPQQTSSYSRPQY